MGYGFNRTEVCYSASTIKQSPPRYENERLSLIGDAFSVYSFVIVAAGLCKAYMPKVHVHHLYNRMGLAPGWVAPWRLTAPLSRSLRYGFQSFSDGVGVSCLNRLLLTRVNHTGSDIRVASGVIMNPKAYPRQSVEAGWWTWEPVVGFKRAHADHINKLELRAILQSVDYSVRHHKALDMRLFHVTDSYVCMSVAGKGRSGSRLLNRVLKALNARLLSHGLTLVLGHVESTKNPTDGASRTT